MSKSKAKTVGSMLAEAIDALTLESVFLKNSFVQVADSFDPQFFDGRLKVNFDVSPRQWVQVSHNGLDYLICPVDCMFFVLDDSHQLSDSPSADEIRNALALEANLQFVAKYQMIKDIQVSNDALDVFAERNAVFHVWPYWREFLSTTLPRYNFAPYTLPMYRPKKRVQK